ncbi:MAG: hypothetical protein JOY98_12595 [Candidatus Eremiobacteraeota bacterium]|nr:hypothetical protein [Candidatus Eremiobacteraeota bacterium]MBV8723517.1 hypothetical protein [Candidatus Eremiobacteraeota bacterium]
MSEYFIGAGALLTAGPAASITSATLHAQTDMPLAGRIGAAVIDFEGGSVAELSRVLIVAAGWTSARFDADVVRPLLDRRDCSLADVLEQLARAADTSELHLFARWLPDAALTWSLQQRGLSVVGHPLEAIEQAALVCGQRLRRLRAPFRAA